MKMQTDCTPLAERPIHPKYGPALGGRPREIQGFAFRPYRTGILMSCWATDAHTIEIRDHKNKNGLATGYCASVHGNYIKRPGTQYARVFRSFEGAAKAALALL